MGTRFRKSIKLGGGARINLSKSGVGFSVGTKGARLTKTARGTTRTTLSIPGSGLSYVSETGKGRAAARKSEAADCAPLDRLEGLEEYSQPEPAADEQPVQPEAPAYIEQRSTAEDAANAVRVAGRTGFGLFLLMSAFVMQSNIVSFLGVLTLALITLPIQAIDSRLPLRGWKKWTLVALLLFVLVGIWGGDPKPDTPARAMPIAEETTEATTEPETIPETEPETEPEAEPATIPTMPAEIVTETVPMREYVLNTSSLKIHKPGCSSVKDIAPHNREEVTANIAVLEAQGYDPCGRCKPF